MLLLALSVSVMVGCSPSEESIKKVLKENPDIVFDLIKDNPQKFMETVQDAARKARPQQDRAAQRDPSEQIEEELKNPKNPTVEENRVLGKKDAPITIVEYTDFECPYCARGNQTMKQLKGSHGDKVRFVRKHLPLPMHPNAKSIATTYELIALQSLQKAHDFVDLAFERQRELGNPSVIEELVKKSGADLKRLKKDQANAETMKAITSRIDADIREAQNMGFQGTPGYLVNGVSVKGAYPADYFNKIIERLQQK